MHRGPVFNHYPLFNQLTQSGRRVCSQLQPAAQFHPGHPGADGILPMVVMEGAGRPIGQAFPVGSRHQLTLVTLAKPDHFPFPDQCFDGRLRFLNRLAGLGKQGGDFQGFLGFQQRQDDFFSGALLPRFQVIDYFRTEPAESFCPDIDDFTTAQGFRSRPDDIMITVNGGDRLCQ